MSKLTSTLLYSLTGAAAFASLPSCKNTPEAAEKKMNILYIMSDDHSYQTISAYDQRYIHTPNIDRIGNEGVRFTNSFVANSISGPSRACMLTGKHSHANGFINNSTTFNGDQMTFPKLLQLNGYETAMIGKWHLVSDPQGFDHWEILPGQGDYYNPTFIQMNGEKVQVEGYATNIITDKAIDWIENQRDENKPFCMLLHHKAPHRTWMPDTCDFKLFAGQNFPLPENFYDNYEGRLAAQKQEMSIDKDMDLVYDLKMADKENEIEGGVYAQWGRSMYNNMNPAQKAAGDAHYDPIIAKFKKDKLSGKALAEWKYQQYMRDYLRVITSVDRNIGRVLDYLEEKGLLENTLVVYTSDQGFYMGEHGWFDKRFMYEESFRTPLLMRLPGSKKGDVTKLVQNIDYAPTFLELAGIEKPEEMHGESLLPLLKGEKTPEWRNSLYYHFYEYPAEHSVCRHFGVRNNRYKLIHYYNDIDTWELFDLQEDPSEMNNLYGKPGTEAITQELKTELKRLQAYYDDPIRKEIVIE